MREVWINHKQVDFGNAAQQQKVTPGCALMQDNDPDEVSTDDEIDDDEGVVVDQPIDPCSDNLCKQGSKCVPTTKSDYICKCRPGFKGKYCEQGEAESKYTGIGTNLSLLSMTCRFVDRLLVYKR